MRVRVRCARETCARSWEQKVETPPPALTCPACGTSHDWNIAAIAGEQIHSCPICGSDELYVRKDFPQRLGLVLVFVVGLVSIWFLARGKLLWALGVLAALVIVDLAIYHLVPLITVCYRCRTEFRGAPINPQHGGFDLATAEKYR